MSQLPLRVRLFAHVETWRLYTVSYVGLVGLAGATLANPHPPAWRLLAAWAAPTLGWLAGLYGGDFFDRKLDAIAKPQRPIPSGRLPARVALTCMIGCVVAGAALTAVVNWRALLLVGVTLILGIAYNTWFKARGFSGNVARGALTAFALVFGSMATATFPPIGLFLVAGVFWLHDAGSNLIGAIRDIDGDRDGGYPTLPVRRGVTVSLWTATTLYLLWLTLAAAAPLVVGRPVTPGFGALLVLAAAGGLGALVIPARAPRPLLSRRALRAHKLLCLERVVLAGAFVAWGAGLALALPVTVAALALTGLTLQLRNRYEFAAAGPAVTREAILEYVDGQVRSLDAAERPMAMLAGWDRRIDIEITDVSLRLCLIVAGGTVRRTDPASDAGGRTAISIATTSTAFGDIFLRGTSNARREYLAGNVTMSAAPRDMLRLNQVFNEFRRRSIGSSVPVVVVEPPAAPPDAVPPDQLPPQFVISDTTLRDGEQAPGVAFTVEQKVALATRLAALGIPLIEVGFPVVSAEEAEGVRAVVAAGLAADIQVIARPVTGDIDAAVDSGAHSIAIFVGTSDAHLRTKLRTTPERLIRQVAEAVAYAKQSGRQVVFAAEDATRTEPEFLVEVYRSATEAGADALGLADTAGVATPWSMARLVRRVGAACALPLAVHCHNDLGLATANSLAGLLSGANAVQCSVLGLGERAGNAPLEELAMSIEVAFGRPTGLDLRLLTPLAEYLSGLLGAAVPPGKPVVGPNAFVHESGLHVDGIVRDPSTYEPYPPELLGRVRRIVFGKHSGRSGLLQVLEQHDMRLSDAQLGVLLDQVKRREPGTGALDDDAVVAIARDLVTVAGSRQPSRNAG